MAGPPALTPDMTVRQVATYWPACVPLLQDCAHARWDERWSLQEVAHLAKFNGREVEPFLQELATAAGVPVAMPSSPHTRASPVPLLFTALALGLTLGAGWGVGLLLQIAWGADFGMVRPGSIHAHGVAQLWGWMALFIFAIATHLLRQNTARPAPIWLERTAAGFIVAGLLGFWGGAIEPLRTAFPAIHIASSTLLAVAALLFGVSVLWSLAGRTHGQRRHGFVILVGWLWVWAGVDLWLRVHHGSMAVLPDRARELLIILPVLGLGVTAVYGFGVQLLPGLLNIQRLRPLYFASGLTLHTIALVLFLTPWQPLQLLGSAGMVVAAVLYLVGLDGLRSQPSRPIYGLDTRGHVMIRVAFFWLVIGLVMVFIHQLFPGLPHAYRGAWRHALTVGFITTMILGVGHRLVPMFIKQPLASPRMMLTAAGLIIVGNTGRVVLELATLGGRPWAYQLMGITGVLELAALALFALNLALTVRNRRRGYRSDQPLTPDTRVREAVNARPELQRHLRQLGITRFDRTPFIAPSLTFGALALASQWKPGELAATLNAAATPPATCLAAV